jgi:ribosome-binding protein aMBF1 (putative translation factor)
MFTPAPNHERPRKRDHMIKDDKSIPVPRLPFARRATGADLKKARQAAKLTTSEMATKLGMAVSDLIKIEEGNVAMPSAIASKVQTICKIGDDWTGA